MVLELCDQELSPIRTERSNQPLYLVRRAKRLTLESVYRWSDVAIRNFLFWIRGQVLNSWNARKGNSGSTNKPLKIS
jgi:hypothetical protein